MKDRIGIFEGKFYKDEMRSNIFKLVDRLGTMDEVDVVIKRSDFGMDLLEYSERNSYRVTTSPINSWSINDEGSLVVMDEDGIEYSVIECNKIATDNPELKSLRGDTVFVKSHKSIIEGVLNDFNIGKNVTLVYKGLIDIGLKRTDVNKIRISYALGSIYEAKEITYEV